MAENPSLINTGMGFRAESWVADLAEDIARDYQSEQMFDERRGLDYANYHLATTVDYLRLMGYDQPCCRALAWMHDLPEDTKLPKEVVAQDVISRGLPWYILEMSFELERVSGEDYHDEYFPRVMNSNWPCVPVVKRADSGSNWSYLMNRMNIGDFDDLEKDGFRFGKYLGNMQISEKYLTVPDHVLGVPAYEQRARPEAQSIQALSTRSNKAPAVRMPPILIGKWPLSESVTIAA